jgi:carnitine O-acetyltransferase
MDEAARNFWTGCGNSAGNRWYDKTMQLTCTKDGRVAYVGEHSMLDAAPAISVLTRVQKASYKKLIRKEAPLEDENFNPGEGVSNVFEKCWSSPALLRTASELTSQAKKQQSKMAGEYDIKMEIFKGFGKKYLKEAGFEPNDFVQMAMQLAAYRLYGRPVGTYEASQTRKFRHGRTETIRPLSLESEAFVKCMGLKPHDEGDIATCEDRLYLLDQAVLKHSEYGAEAVQGMGVDRHFFGLSQSMEPGENEPALFSNPLFQDSKNWRLSTSFVTYAPGFAPTADDGVGIGYLIEKDSCFFTITSRKDNGYAEKFRDLLEEALQEMGELVKPVQ